MKFVLMHIVEHIIYQSDIFLIINNPLRFWTTILYLIFVSPDLDKWFPELIKCWYEIVFCVVLLLFHDNNITM
jgi:hypothetical protein